MTTYAPCKRCGGLTACLQGKRKHKRIEYKPRTPKRSTLKARRKK